MTTLTIASTQWATRPDDERFLDIDSLIEAVKLRKQFNRQPLWSFDSHSKEPIFSLAYSEEENDVPLYATLKGATDRFVFTHHSLGQLATRAGAPAGYIRSLPAPLAAANLSYGLNHNPNARESAKLYLVPAFGRNEQGQMEVVRDRSDRPLGEVLAVTGPDYGRVFDMDVALATKRMIDNSGGAWKVPAASYSATDPRRATTLYASKKDVFIFLVDEERTIDVHGRQIKRFIVIFNSEVGDRMLGIMSGSYDYVCDNRMIWGAKDVNSIKVRHSSGAPERFINEVRPMLEAYAHSSSLPLEAQIKASAQTPLRLESGKVASTVSEQVKWFQEQGFSGVVAKSAVQLANEEEGDCGSIFDAVQGLTAHARGIPFQDKRTDLETQAGALMAKYARVDAPVRITMPERPASRLPALTMATVNAAN
jgi:hypothetical protein